MICVGQASIDYLAAEASKDDPGASSHWQKYHSGFQFSGEGFRGLQGFGGCAKPYRGLGLALHRLLQKRFRFMGTAFPEFRLIDKLAYEVTTRQTRAYDLDVLRQVLTLAFLKARVPTVLTEKKTSCVIGDGFASMAVLLLASRSAGRVVLINLTKTLLVDLWFLRLWLGKVAFASRVDLVTDEEGLARALAKPVTSDEGGRVVAIQAVHHKLLRGCPADLTLNIASMQEMDPPVIASYFEELRTIAEQREIAFYCCNREEKVLPDGTVSRFSAYPWHTDDWVLVDELCPWHQQYYSLRPPFYRRYDGAHRHRLVIMGSDSSPTQSTEKLKA